MARLILFFIAIAVLYLFIPQKVSAQSCTGSAQCLEPFTYYTPLGCVPGFPSYLNGCTGTQTVWGPGSSPVYCGFVNGTCSSFTACDEIPGQPAVYVQCTYTAAPQPTSVPWVPTSTPWPTPTPLPLCPQNQGGANTIQCQGSCVQDWSPLGGYRCASGGQCCQKNPPSVCPGGTLPNGSANQCIPNATSCPAGSTANGSLTNNACGAGSVCCNFPPATSCPGGCRGASGPGGTCTPPGGGTGYWYNESSGDNYCTYQTYIGNQSGNYCWTCEQSATPTPTRIPTPTPTNSPTCPNSLYVCAATCYQGENTPASYLCGGSLKCCNRPNSSPTPTSTAPTATPRPPTATPRPPTATPPVCSSFSYCSGSQACTESTCGPSTTTSCSNCPTGCTAGVCNPTPTFYYIGVFIDSNNNGVFDNVGNATTPDLAGSGRFLLELGGSGDYLNVSGWGGFSSSQNVQSFSRVSVASGYTVISTTGRTSAPFPDQGRHVVLLRQLPATPTNTPAPTATPVPIMHRLQVRTWVDMGSYNGVYQSGVDTYAPAGATIGITRPNGTVDTYPVCRQSSCSMYAVNTDYAPHATTQYVSQLNNYNQGLYTLRTPVDPYSFSFTAPTTINYVLRETRPSPCGAYGDIDGDGRVSRLDLTEVQRIVLGHTTNSSGVSYTAQQRANADINNSGSWTAADMSGISGYVNETLSTFPACIPPTATLTPTPTLVVRTVSGQVYEDANNNSTKDTSEVGYTDSSVHVYANNSSNVPVADGYTNIATGNYTTGGMVAGNYRMSADAVPGFTINPGPTIAVGAANRTGINIGLYQADTCHDTTNNNSTSNNAFGVTSDCNDSMCHTDYNPRNAASCCTAGSTLCGAGEDRVPTTTCNDSLDNDGDGTIDGGDANCHTGDTPSGPFDPNRDEIPEPSCTFGVRIGSSGSVSSATVPAGGSTVLRAFTCTNVDPIVTPPAIPIMPPPYPYDWTPNRPGTPPTGDVPLCSASTPGGANITNIVNTNTNSQVTWNAPVCPTTTITCRPQVSISGPNGTVRTYSNSTITVNAASSITVNVRMLSSNSETCTATAGTAVPNASVNISPVLPVGSNAGGTTNSSGQYQYTCKPSGTYTVRVGDLAGNEIVDRVGGSNVSTNGISLTPGAGNNPITFCVLPNTPWAQTDTGNVRYVNISNPVPVGQFASLGESPTTPAQSSYPGIFYSSAGNADFGAGDNSASSKGWVVSNEYDYGADTKNRNGGVSYEFFKSKLKQDAVDVISMTGDTFTLPANAESGVYEFAAENTTVNINSYSHPDGKRIVLLVNGNVNINTNIIVPRVANATPGTGNLLIVAAKGNIVISENIGVDPATGYSLADETTHSLDGFYSAQGNITLRSLDNSCQNGVPDLRLNVGGALIANARKPFATDGTSGGGVIDNGRSLCAENLLYPSLFTASRPDFLIQLTDFYKTSYTKWQEVNP